MQPITTFADVVVVGAGNAALTAAIAAAERGAQVAVLEAAPESHAGGNSRFTLGGFRFGFGDPAEVDALVPDATDQQREMVRRCPYGSDEYFADLIRLSRGEADAALCRMLARESCGVLRWMRGLGVRWGLHISGIESEPMWLASPGNVYAAGRGRGLVAALMEKAGALGVRVLYSHRLERVLLDGRGRARGLLVDRGGEPAELGCRSVVVACGGFEADAQMRRRHLGEAWGRMKVRGTPFNVGKGLAALLAAGAVRAGAWGGGHAVPIAADSPDVGNFELGETTRRCLFQYGVSVNKSGRRFMDEGADRKQFMYSTTGVAVASEDGGAAYQVFDARLLAANFEKDFYFSGRYFSAGTLEELAGLIGVPPGRFLAELEAYNAAVADDRAFDPGRLDGSSAPGVTPPRTNYAARIVEPPFFAFEVVGGITFTYGGVAIDQQCRVLRHGAEPIPGVYAAGEITGGFFAHTYPANAGLMRGAVTGWVGGRSAAS